MATYPREVGGAITPGLQGQQLQLMIMKDTCSSSGAEGAWPHHTLLRLWFTVGAPALARRCVARHSRRRRQGPPPRPYDTATIGAALARAPPTALPPEGSLRRGGGKDLIIFPDDCEFKRVPQCPSGRVYVLKFKAGSKRLFFWMQEPKTDQDEEHCRKVNECLNNPPMPGALGAGGGGGHELSALGGEGGLQSLLGNMSHSQLMQLIGPAGLGGLGGLGALTGPGLASLLGSGAPPASSSSSSSRSQSAAVTPSSTASSARATPAPSAPAAASATSPSPAPSSGSGASTAASPTQPIQLSDLQSILATMNVPAGPGGGQQVDLASVLTPEIMAPILANADVQERLLPYLPSGESLPQTAEEIQNTLTSPQFQQALGMFSAALASGQLGPLMCQFGLPTEAVEAANKGDVEAFAKAMQNSARPEPPEGDGKDKKDEEEDMSLD
ncbi:PREDICTED: proteasomal ubiquitin receptor ADRM1 [Condylura cristata]|uniref:proteasomal ubiquitin receptor ADRM1 n=1 Tax=Condylura cristata TaxID=143302 RepID=UPI000643923C|nr:PREDICTED: proteasomal ubiquitin receptor ADRM1 [Condylura cristata]